jgi:glycosyltransferase involved in cell wall biosynthesis
LRISIVIPAFNEARLLPATLREVQGACQALWERRWETESIVCDNNSSDATAEVARAAGAQVVFEPINQIARARNTGAAAATGEWLIFIDADSHPSRELFQDAADQIESGKCLAGGSTVRLEEGYPWATRGVEFWNWLSRRLHWVAGSFVFCETNAFRTIGGFSHELFASEEVDLSRRLKRLARKLGKEIVILDRFPLLTSARKMHLYSPWEHAWFLTKTVLLGGRTLRNRSACFTWYDGRR